MEEPNLPIQDKRAMPALRVFARRLANLSARNRGLMLLRLYKGQAVDLHAFDGLTGKPARVLLEEWIAGASAIPLCSAGLGGTGHAELSRRLTLISRSAKELKEETGADALALAWPMVQGQWPDGGLVRAPLLFWPCRIAQVAGQWRLERDPDQEPAFNKAFLVAYAHYLGTPVPEALDEYDFDEAPRDALAFRTAIYELLKGAGMQIHFNQELFREPLRAFAELKRDDLQKLTELGLLKLQPEAVIGIFPQADSFMGEDYRLMEEAGLTPETLLAKSEANAAPTAPPAWPLEADGSQAQVLRQARAGRSLVVQGPPGTGKSQLIANLAADAMALGKRVLVVCQKRAALDVVYARLAEVRLGDGVALVHDFKADRPTVFARLAAILADKSTAQEALSHAEATQAQARYEALHAEQAAIDAELEAYRAALFDRSQAGRSAKELYLSADANSPHIEIPTTALATLRYPAQEAFAAHLLDLDHQRGLQQGMHPLWKLRKSYAELTDKHLNQLGASVKGFAEAQASLAALAHRSKPTLKQWRAWMRLATAPGTKADLERLEGMLKSPPSPSPLGQGGQGGGDEVLQPALHLARRLPKARLRAYCKELRTLRKRNLHKNALAHAALQHAFAAMVRPGGATLLAALKAGAEARARGWLYWIAYRLFRTDAQAVGRLMAGTPKTPEGFALVESALAARLRLERFARATQAALPGVAMPDPADDPAWEAALAYLEQVAWLARFYQKRKLVKLAGKALRDAPSAQAWLAQARATLPRLVTFWQGASPLLTRPQWKMLASAKPPAIQGVLESLARHGEALRESDRIMAGLSAEEKRIMAALLKTGQPLARTFANSLALAWIAALEEQAPLLRASASGRLDALSARTLDAAEQLRLRAPAAVHRARAARPAAASPQALRELAHQAGKKRRIWPLRKLIGMYTDAVLEAMPCWLASPETVSAIMPMEAGLFDVVIYDEASQCFAERGLPAAYRARQILVVGDRMQLAPSDLYRVRYEGDEDEADAPEADALSLLDLAALYLPGTGLQTHYRSHAPELIAFSNTRFYGGALQVLPHLQAVGGPPAIQVRLVPDGRWENQTNTAEAEAVADLLASYAEDVGQGNAIPTIGVITFNQPQQDLIEDVLEARGIALPEAAALFVKNIENVQGDERDVIIFSTAYAPDAEGKLRLNFGSLSRQGGENRLNVAATRARAQIVLVTSLGPGVLQPGPGAAAGAQALAAFIDYCHAVNAGDSLISLATDTAASQPSPARHALTTQEVLLAQDKGLQPWPNFADLLRSVDGLPTALVFTDDARFEAAPTAADYLAHRPALARAKGWQTEWRHARGVFKGR